MSHIINFYLIYHLCIFVYTSYISYNAETDGSRINPVTGCYEEPKPNMLEGMTEEQKEYEALKLVELVDKLSRSGIVQPCRVGEDGKPKPIEHVLELQEGLPNQQYQRRDSSSD